MSRSRVKFSPEIRAAEIVLAGRRQARNAHRFKTEIDAFVGRLGPGSNGTAKWVGSDPYEIRRDGEALLAIIENARLSLDTPQPGQLVLDRIEIREIARKDEGKLIELALVLPKNVILRETDGTDRRVVRVTITAEGRRALQRIRTLKNAYLTRRLAALEPAEQELAEALTSLLEHLVAEG